MGRNRANDDLLGRAWAAEDRAWDRAMVLRDDAKALPWHRRWKLWRASRRALRDWHDLYVQRQEVMNATAVLDIKRRAIEDRAGGDHDS